MENQNDPSLVVLIDAAMALGRVWGGMAYSSAEKLLLRAAKEYYEVHRNESDPPTDSPIECP